MSQSSHSRFSMLKRKYRRLRRERRTTQLPQVQRSVPIQSVRPEEDTTPYPSEEILWIGGVVPGDLPRLSHSTREVHPTKTDDARTVLLEPHFRVFGDRNCPCCGLPFEREESR